MGQGGAPYAFVRRLTVMARILRTVGENESVFVEARIDAHTRVTKVQVQVQDDVFGKCVDDSMD